MTADYDYLGSFQRAAFGRELLDETFDPDEEDDDETESDEAGQIRLGVAGEQRGFPGMSQGPAPAPTTATLIDCHGCGLSHYPPGCD